MLIARSAAGPTTVLTVAVLLAGKGSVVCALTLAMAVIFPTAVGVTMIVALGDDPRARFVRLQMTTLPMVLTVPRETVVDWICTLAGKAVVTVILVAALGPLLASETV